MFERVIFPWSGNEAILDDQISNTKGSFVFHQFNMPNNCLDIKGNQFNFNIYSLFLIFQLCLIESCFLTMVLFKIFTKNLFYQRTVKYKVQPWWPRKQICYKSGAFTHTSRTGVRVWITFTFSDVKSGMDNKSGLGQVVGWSNSVFMIKIPDLFHWQK